jgi:hypothetical protein
VGHDAKPKGEHTLEATGAQVPSTLVVWIVHCGDVKLAILSLTLLNVISSKFVGVKTNRAGISVGWLCGSSTSKTHFNNE